MTATLDEPRVTFGDGEVTTPRLRTSGRRALFWVVLAVIVILFVTATIALTGTSPDKTRLSPVNPSPNGAEALISVLRSDGVTVATPQSLGAAEHDASGHAGSTTLVVYDQNSILTESQFEQLDTVAGNLVLIEPDSAALDALAPDVAEAGILSGATHSAGCTLPLAQRAHTVSGLARGYRITSASVDATGCFGGGGVSSLVRVDNPNQTVTVVGATTTFTNASIVSKGNAALALGLFGENTHLVWYLPTFTDANVLQDGNVPNPPWVFWTIVLAGLVLVAAGVWRGRRFGPVVVERMPVFVRSSETIEGRARLYQKSSARGHALDSLRIGVIGRIASNYGLPTRASVDEVIGTIARTTGRKPAELRSLLVDELPYSDAALMKLSDDLAELEAEVAKTVRP
jgi:hypothetical protein